LEPPGSQIIDGNTAKSIASVEVIPGGTVNGSIRPPGSKSLTNRALICAAFAAPTGGPDARRESVLTGALRSEDTEVMIAAVERVGGRVVSSQGGRTLRITAVPDHVAGVRPREELGIANSGTTVRFLTAALSAHGGHYRLHGVPRMHERPIGDLIEAIGSVIDGTIRTESPGRCPPVEIDSCGWKAKPMTVRGNVSSQYLSGLMMAAPIGSANRRPAVAAAAESTAPGNVTANETVIRVAGELVSLPYVEMTARVMRDFGATAELSAIAATTNPGGDEAITHEVRVAETPYQATEYAIEPDASAASYFWAAAAITGGTVTVEGLSANALQGDVALVDVLEKMGCHVDRGPDQITVTGAALHGIDVDMNPISDTVQTLSMVALFAAGPTRVRGVAHNRFKETDRIGDLATELRKLGAIVEEHDDGLTIHPLADVASPGRRDVTLETYHDHRMAMSFALAGLKIAGVRIADPACTSKTYPEYFADLQRLIGRPHVWRSW